MKVIGIAYRVIFVAAVICIVVLMLVSLLLGISGFDKENPKSVLGYRAFIVLSGSMSPTFNEGSLIVVKETPEEKLKENDIITYRPLEGNETLLTHRIVKINEESNLKTFTTRGDANNTDDPNPVQYASVLGKTIFYMDGAGYFIVNLRTPIGIGGMVAVIILVLFVFPYLIDIAAKPKKSAEIIKKEEEKTEDKK